MHGSEDSLRVKVNRMKRSPRLSHHDDLITASAVPPVVYHGTFGHYLRSIFLYGLGGIAVTKNWQRSRDGMIYLASDPFVAESYADSSEVVPPEYLEQIVVLAVETSRLDRHRFFLDRSLPDTHSVLIYRGVIPPPAMAVLEPA